MYGHVMHIETSESLSAPERKPLLQLNKLASFMNIAAGIFLTGAAVNTSSLDTGKVGAGLLLVGVGAYYSGRVLEDESRFDK